MVYKTNYLDRAKALAAELIDICHDADKPLAADFVQAAIDYLVDPVAYVALTERCPQQGKTERAACDPLS
jgi:hypothetical protein